MQQQIAKFEDEDEDLFVAVNGEGRITDGLVDYGTCDFSFGSWTLPRLEALLADDASARALEQDCMLCCFPFSDKARWLPANLQPRCTLEALAMALFEEHTRGVASFDRERSGCEWWAQIRRPDDAHESIGFHWDKDEQLNTAVDGLFVQPQLACVTYLSETGAPTCVVPITPQPFVSSGGVAGGAPVSSEMPVFLSHPRPGKTMRFDGRFLHGAPAARRVDRKAVSTRYTFLCNIWLNHRPICSKPCPQAVVEKMSQLLHFSAESRQLIGGPQHTDGTSSEALLQIDTQPPAVAVVLEGLKSRAGGCLCAASREADQCDVCGHQGSSKDPCCKEELYDTNDVAQAKPHGLRLALPSLDFCRGESNVAVVDTRRDQGAWLLPVSTHGGADADGPASKRRATSANAVGS
eukprot:COSAG03_NODE_4053_length_1707_cov_1.921020_2_plen_408_part_00